jgi:hypothetical protein
MVFAHLRVDILSPRFGFGVQCTGFEKRGGERQMTVGATCGPRILASPIVWPDWTPPAMAPPINGAVFAVASKAAASTEIRTISMTVLRGRFFRQWIGNAA